jgi:hypothetical protein
LSFYDVQQKRHKFSLETYSFFLEYLKQGKERKKKIEEKENIFHK